MKKTISFIISCSMLCGSSAAITQANAIESSTYEDYLEKRDDIPQFPDPEIQGISVTDGNYVFQIYDEFALLYDYKDTKATEVNIPAYVKNPDTEKEIPVVGVADTPFDFCWDLEKITIPETMTKINWYDLSITTAVKAGSNANPIPKLSEISVSDSNPNYTVVDGILFSKDLKTVVGCPPALEITELKLPQETETIGDYAFLACYNLETAAIPSTVKHINNSALFGCINLKSAELPDTISFVSSECFCYCSSLTDIKINGDISAIGVGAFRYCSSLSQFDIPETVTAIGMNAFSDTKLAENIDGVYYLDNWVIGSDEDVNNAIIQKGTIGIAEMAFMNRQHCTIVDIPDSVKYIGLNCYTGLSTGEPSKIIYRASKLPEKAFMSAKNATDFYFYDSGCVIYDSEKTIPAEFKYINSHSADDEDDYILLWDDITSDPINTTDKYITGDITIHGYKDSTAQAYAKKYGRKFELIHDEPEYIPGDVNDDGDFGIADAVSLQKWLLGNVESGQINWEAADLYNDDVINTFDLIMMRKQLITK